MGADEAIQDTAVNRYDLQDKAPKQVAKAARAPAPAPVQTSDAEQVDAVALARQAATAAQDLEGLRAAMEAFAHCDLKAGARNLVFSDGVAGARVMIVTEAPDRNEDREGKPFVGPAGLLLDRMLEAIDMGRTHESRPVYITSVLPWRPAQQSTPAPHDIAMMLPFLERHIALAKPDVLILMGNAPCQALLGRNGITRMRGSWLQAAGLPALPMFHPAHLMANPTAKRDAWADLLALKSKLESPA